MTEETTRTAIPLLGQLAHVHLESNPLHLGRNYQLDCRLLLPIRPFLILELSGLSLVHVNKNSIL